MAPHHRGARRGARPDGPRSPRPHRPSARHPSRSPPCRARPVAPRAGSAPDRWSCGAVYVHRHVRSMYVRVAQGTGQEVAGTVVRSRQSGANGGHDGARRSHSGERGRSRGRTGPHLRRPDACEVPRPRTPGGDPGRRFRGLGLRRPAHRDVRPERRRRHTARGVRRRPDALRPDAGRVLRHPRAHRRHERERRARVDVLPDVSAFLRAVVPGCRREGSRARAERGPRLQRLAHRRVGGHLSRPVHSALARTALGSAADGRRDPARRREGLSRGHVLREP